MMAEQTRIGPNLAPGEQPFPNGWEWDETVAACAHNDWETVLVRPRVGYVTECARCVKCHAPRCGYARDEDPCLLVRHHGVHHVHASGSIEAVGGYQCANGRGCACGATQ